MNSARRAFLDVTLSGANITDSIKEDVLSFSYTDNAEQEIDDISLTIQNRTGKWLRSWFPKTTDKISAKIVTEDWTGSLNCGGFTVAEVDFSISPMTVSIKAVAIPVQSDFTRIAQSRTWEQATIKEVATTIAEASKMPLDWRSSYNQKIPIISQMGVSNSAFLYSLCQKYGLTLKLFSERIVIYDAEELEKLPPIKVISSKDMISCTCKSTVVDSCYTGVCVKYMTTDGKVFSYTHKVESKTPRIYNVQTAVNSFAEAERVSKATLRTLNKREATASFTIAGDTRMYAGTTIALKDLGSFDGNYFIDKATHSLSGGYTTAVECHRV